jgi:hypothetical protein
VGEVEIFIFYQVTQLELNSSKTAEQKMSKDQKRALLELLKTSVSSPNQQATDVFKVRYEEIIKDSCNRFFLQEIVRLESEKLDLTKILDEDEEFSSPLYAPSLQNKGIVSVLRQQADEIDGRLPLWFFKHQSTFYRCEWIENENFGGKRIYKVTRDVNVKLKN